MADVSSPRPVPGLHQLESVLSSPPEPPPVQTMTPELVMISIISVNNITISYLSHPLDGDSEHSVSSLTVQCHLQLNLSTTNQRSVFRNQPIRDQHQVQSTNQRSVFSRINQSDLSIYHLIISNRQRILDIQVAATIKDWLHVTKYSRVCLDHGLDDLSVDSVDNEDVLVLILVANH